MKIWNKRLDKNIPKNAVYVGRPSRWGNPYSHIKDSKFAIHQVATRADAIHLFAIMVATNRAMRIEIKRLLKGKDLVCWCAPERCHAEILMRIANE